MGRSFKCNLVRAHASHVGGCGFKPRRSRQNLGSLLILGRLPRLLRSFGLIRYFSISSFYDPPSSEGVHHHCSQYVNHCGSSVDHEGSSCHE
jgi:hypothetical protein